MPAPAPTPPDGGVDAKIEALHELVLRSLDDDQAVEVVSIPLVGKSSIADHMVIASGRSTRKVASFDAAGSNAYPSTAKAFNCSGDASRFSTANRAIKPRARFA